MHTFHCTNRRLFYQHWSQYHRIQFPNSEYFLHEWKMRKRYVQRRPKYHKHGIWLFLRFEDFILPSANLTIPPTIIMHKAITFPIVKMTCIRAAKTTLRPLMRSRSTVIWVYKRVQRFNTGSILLFHCLVHVILLMHVQEVFGGVVRSPKSGALVSLQKWFTG